MSKMNATPATTAGTTVSGTPFTMPDLAANVPATPTTPAVEYRRTVQSIVVMSLESTETEYCIKYGTQKIFQFKLKLNETFTIEGLRTTQLSSNNSGTKISCETVSTGRTTGANIVVSYATITITG
jgi:hypothetical protein